MSRCVGRRGVVSWAVLGCGVVSWAVLGCAVLSWGVLSWGVLGPVAAGPGALS